MPTSKDLDTLANVWAKCIFLKKTHLRSKCKKTNICLKKISLQIFPNFFITKI